MLTAKTLKHIFQMRVAEIISHFGTTGQTEPITDETSLEENSIVQDIERSQYVLQSDESIIPLILAYFRQH